MRSKLVYQADGLRTFVVVLASGDEAMASIAEFAVRERLDGAQITAIGAFSEAVISYFDWAAKDYRPIPVDEQVEVASMMGDIAMGTDGAPAVHVHVVLGRQDGSALAGHLTRGLVRPTLEVVVTETPAHLRKEKDEASGLALIRL